MLQQLASFRLQTVKAVFDAHGLFILKDYDDGQILWGNEASSSPYNGLFYIASDFTPSAMTYSLFGES